MNKEKLENELIELKKELVIANEELNAERSSDIQCRINDIYAILWEIDYLNGELN